MRPSDPQPPDESSAATQRPSLTQLLSTATAEAARLKARGTEAAEKRKRTQGDIAAERVAAAADASAGDTADQREERSRMRSTWQSIPANKIREPRAASDKTPAWTGSGYVPRIGDDYKNPRGRPWYEPRRSEAMDPTIEHPDTPIYNTLRHGHTELRGGL